MAYNLFIAYDLIPPGQNYEVVRDKIRSLGQWHQFQYSLFYVSTDLSPQQAYAEVFAVMDARDRLAVINCDFALGAIVSNYDQPLIEAINAIWVRP